MSELLQSLPPVAGDSARVLILGSMPGAQSLQAGRYYVGRGNRFWSLMSRLLEFDADLPYDERIAALSSARIALWDVLKHCERDGSLDASIRAASEEPNDFSAFRATHPELSITVFNGRKAAASFEELVPGALPATVTLPSTSGANARMSLEQLVQEWSVILDHLN